MPSRVHNAEAVRVAVGGNAEVRASLFHLGLGVAQQMVVRLRRMAAEEHVAVIVNRLDGHARLAQNLGAIAAPRAPERIVDHLDARLGDGLQVHQLGQPLEEGGLHVGGLEAARRALACGIAAPLARSATIAASICLVTSGSAGAPSCVENLMPLYSGGLCEAVKLIAPEVFSVTHRIGDGRRRRGLGNHNRRNARPRPAPAPPRPQSSRPESADRGPPAPGAAPAASSHRRQSPPPPAGYWPR